MKIGLRLGCVFATLLVSVTTACSHPNKTITDSWDPKTAAAYLDQRQVTWMGWPGSARDHGTFCVACHTGLPYALSRPALRRALGEQGPSINERRLLENVTKRVLLWNQVEPFYKDGPTYHDNKSAQSRGTESVLNALILATADAQTGVLSNPTRIAFDNMWALQETAGEERGAWAWLQFELEPWEAEDSQYYGATLAAIAVGTAPENYRLSPEIQNRVTMLRDYLNREYATQSTMNRVALLWASAKLPGLLDSERQKTDHQGSHESATIRWRLETVLAGMAEWLGLTFFRSDAAASRLDEPRPTKRWLCDGSHHTRSTTGRDAAHGAYHETGTGLVGK